MNLQCQPNPNCCRSCVVRKTCRIDQCHQIQLFPAAAIVSAECQFECRRHHTSPGLVPKFSVMPWKLVSSIIGIPTVGYKSTLLQYPNKSCSTILHRHSSQVWHRHVSPGGWLIKGVIHVATNTSVPLQHRWNEGWVSLFNLTNLGWFCGAQFEPHRLSPELHRKCLGQTLSSPEAAVERLSQRALRTGWFF